MKRADEYLAIPARQGKHLGGLRWHPGGEAIVFEAENPTVGMTFAMRDEVLQFLEGYASVRPLVHFALILRMMGMLHHGDPAPSDIGGAVPGNWSVVLALLVGRYVRLHRPLRNVGALFAQLTRDVPPVADPPDIADIRDVLAHGHAWTFHRPDARGESPPLSFFKLHAAAVNALKGLADDEIDHWLRHGRGPVGDVGEEVARAAEASKPRSLATLLDALDGRARLAGASRLVPLLDGALSLPPRRLAPAELPTGGYADVATRGHPEQILPAQFALDDLEFLRRFAERELLYYHREEPRAPRAEELLVVLDQGVRTWGDVRLVLAAAAIALGRQASRRQIAWLVATTANGGHVVDPMAAADAEALGTLIEASDLSTNPGLAVERVLETPTDRPRDIVILTHPRALAEPDVAAAARRAGPDTRLFAVAVDGAGRVEFAELRRGTPVILSRCRVELRRDPEPTFAPRRLAASGPWTGDIEAIGFPFELGLLGPVQDGHFDFDERGEWLLVADRMGLLHAWRVDGVGGEMLPRGKLRGMVLTQVEAVVGVAGGFVVAGSLGHKECAVVVHYDFATRRCVARDLGPWRGEREWFYLREFHAIAVRDPAEPARRAAVDLGTGQVSNSWDDEASHLRGLPHDRANWARKAAIFGPPDRPTVIRVARKDERGALAMLDPDSGRVYLWRTHSEPSDVMVFADNEPTLRGKSLGAVQVAGGVVGLGTVDLSDGSSRIYLFEKASRHIVAEYPLSSPWGFALSRDGRRLARAHGPAIVVQDVGGAGPAVLVTPPGKTHSSLDVELAPHLMRLRGGRVTHLLFWIGGTLQVRRTPIRPEGGGEIPMGSTVEYRPDATGWRPVADSKRFVVHGTCDGLTVLSDVFGQVAVLGANDALVAMFFVFREELAGWLPDGTRFGPPSRIGGPTSPDAMAKFGRALLEASAAAREGVGVP